MDSKPEAGRRPLSLKLMFGPVRTASVPTGTESMPAARRPQKPTKLKSDVDRASVLPPIRVRIKPSSGRKQSRRGQRRRESRVTNLFPRGAIRPELLGDSSEDDDLDDEREGEGGKKRKIRDSGDNNDNDDGDGDAENQGCPGETKLTYRYSTGLVGIHGLSDTGGDGKDTTMSDQIPDDMAYRSLNGPTEYHHRPQQQQQSTPEVYHTSSSVDHVHRSSRPDDNEMETQRLLTITPRSHLVELKQNNTVLRNHNMALVMENERLKAQKQQQQKQGYHGIEGKELVWRRGEISRLERENEVLVECGIEWARREAVLLMEVERLRRVLRDAGVESEGW